MLLDIQLAAGSGLDVLRAATKGHLEVRFIVFSNMSEPIYRKRCLEGGAYALYDKKGGQFGLQQTLRELAGTAPI